MAAGAAASPRSRLTLVLVCAIAGLVVAGLSALGVWQLHRLTWKRELLASIEHRINAPPMEPPGPVAWSSVDAAHDAYRHVTAVGALLPGHDTLVQAVTELGAGYWVMAPLRTDAGFTVLVNRGFVSADDRPTLADGGAQAGQPIRITGLLRVTEPGGGFLRANDPAANRWYSRDVAAIAQTRGLTDVAPYFIDAGATPGGGLPVGGLTVVNLPNNHLSYALTWFAMAAALTIAMGYVVRAEIKASRPERR